MQSIKPARTRTSSKPGSVAWPWRSPRRVGFRSGRYAAISSGVDWRQSDRFVLASTVLIDSSAWLAPSAVVVVVVVRI